MEAVASDRFHQYNISSKKFLSQTTMVDETYLQHNESKSKP
jgi:hypothetical protein